MKPNEGVPDEPVYVYADAQANRHHHSGYMAEYKLAKAFVEPTLQDGKEPLVASWF